MSCFVCGREAIEKYCEFHEEAYQNVVKKFEDWKRATGASWKEYLKELVENAYTGCWAKEVVENSLKDTDG
ncbi:MAG: hypothetical protein PVH73_04475 [Candidatus Bathyarchaeota archaeon]